MVYDPLLMSLIRNNGRPSPSLSSSPAPYPLFHVPKDKALSAIRYPLSPVRHYSGSLLLKVTPTRYPRRSRVAIIKVGHSPTC